jgi:UDP-3-O-[3-hydroxymyristoyl] N-acetylglucosamine deacetylase
MQRTIKNTVSCFGIGVHSGKPASLTLHPAPENSGIQFIRTDITNTSNKIEAKYNLVSNTMLGTTLKNESGVEVATIEHLMAALWGCKIDNIIIEIDGRETPIMDGSSEPFIFVLECAGIKEQDQPRRYIEIIKKVSVQDKDSFATITPDNKFSVNMEIEFANQVISKQTLEFNDIDKSFKNELSRARTFGFAHEGQALKKMGLAQGASLDNAVVISDDQILNKEGLRYQNEFVRHKMLDFIGDCYLAGAPILGHVETYKPGHGINNKLLHQIFSDNSAWRYTTIS